MLPRLVRFYGGSPEEWYWRTPLATVQVFARAMRALRAEDAMVMVERIGVGSGTFTKEARRSTLSAWQRDLGLPARPRRPVSPGVLAALGIGFHPTPRKEPS